MEPLKEGRNYYITKRMPVIIGLILVIIVLAGLVTYLVIRQKQTEAYLGSLNYQSDTYTEESLNKNVISIENNQLSPKELKVNKGEVVVWINNDLAFHTVKGENESFSSERMAPGDGYTFVFEKAGEYSYFLDVNQANKGKIIVNETNNQTKN